MELKVCFWCEKDCKRMKESCTMAKELGDSYSVTILPSTSEEGKRKWLKFKR